MLKNIIINVQDFEKRILNSDESALPVRYSCQNKVHIREARIKHIKTIGAESIELFYGTNEKRASRKGLHKKSSKKISPFINQDILNQTLPPQMTKTNLLENKPSTSAFLTEASFDQKRPITTKTDVKKTTIYEEIEDGKFRSPSPWISPIPNYSWKTRPTTSVLKTTKTQFNWTVKSQKERPFGLKEFRDTIRPKTRMKSSQPDYFLYRSRIFEQVRHRTKSADETYGKSNLIIKDVPTDTASPRDRPKTTLAGKYDPSYIWKVRGMTDSRNHLSSKPQQKHIRQEEERASMIIAKEKVIDMVIKGEQDPRLYNFGEMMRQQHGQRYYDRVVGTKNADMNKTFHATVEPTIVERVLQANDLSREMKRSITPRSEPPFVNIHMKNYREKVGILKTKPRFLNAKPNSPPLSSTGGNTETTMSPRDENLLKMHIRALNPAMFQQ